MKEIKELWKKKVIFDKTKQYRYVLCRITNENLPSITFIMLNPSTANGKEDDSTIRRLKGFMDLWGYGILYVVNLFAYRSSDPLLLKKARDPIGPKNDYYVGLFSSISKKIIIAWGTKGGLYCRGERMLSLLPKSKVYYLEKTRTGYPKHPLYCKKDIQPKRYFKIT